MEKFNQSEYIKEYKKVHYKRINLQLNIESDSDIIELLNEAENKNEFIKSCIRLANAE